MFLTYQIICVFVTLQNVTVPQKPKLNTPKPVSYTHLDVYKRQHVGYIAVIILHKFDLLDVCLLGSLYSQIIKSIWA